MIYIETSQEIRKKSKNIQNHVENGVKIFGRLKKDNNIFTSLFIDKLKIVKLLILKGDKQGDPKKLAPGHIHDFSPSNNLKKNKIYILIILNN